MQIGVIGAAVRLSDKGETPPLALVRRPPTRSCPSFQRRPACLLFLHRSLSFAGGTPSEILKAGLVHSRNELVLLFSK